MSEEFLIEIESSSVNFNIGVLVPSGYNPSHLASPAISFVITSKRNNCFVPVFEKK